MAFSLTDNTSGAVPITPLTKGRFASWAAAAPDPERNWAQSTGFAADAGKLSLVPGENGRLGRVLVGLGGESDAASSIWALAGLPDALPEGSYRLDPGPAGADPTRLALGWALATYAFTRYHAKPASGATLVWPEGADRGLVERLARAVFLARDLVNT
ncbi:MAG: leucyl aminopeptidase family protein, partial [Stellaceae bacterium]